MPTDPNAKTSAHPSLLQRYYEKKALETLEPQLILAPLGMSKKIPKGQGKLVRFHRYSKVTPTPSGALLGEGQTPTESSILTSEIEATIQQYGQWEGVSDLLAFTAIDDQMVQRAERFGQAAADLIEQLHVQELDAEGFARYNGTAGSSSVTASDVMDYKQIIQMITEQEKAFVGSHESGKRVLVVGPSVKYDLMADAQAGGWSDINKYTGAQSKVVNGQFGELYGARLVMSNRMSVVAAGNNGETAPYETDNTVDLHYSYLIGSQAFGNIKLGDQDFKIIKKDLGSAGAADPLNQRASVGYKLMGYVVKFLGENEETKRVIVNRSASAAS